MGSNPVGLRFFQCTKLGTEGSLEEVLKTVSSAGFRSWAFSSKIPNAQELEYELLSQAYKKRGSESLRVAYKHRNLQFVIIDQQGGLDLIVSMDWALTGEGATARPWIHVHTRDTAIFTRKEFDRQYYANRLLQLGKQLYCTVRPRFGWIERLPYWRPETTGYTTEEEVERLEVPHVYWANFFNPAFVSKLGKDFLKQAPGWTCEELDDGGILYVLTPSLEGTGPASVVRKVQEYFGVEHVRRRPSKGRKRSKK